jgi:hypothetical protein
MPLDKRVPPHQPPARPNPRLEAGVIAAVCRVIVAALRQPALALSEIMTIIVSFHWSHYRTFKHYYTDYVDPHLRPYFPMLVSSMRFVELMPHALVPLSCYLYTRKGRCTGIAFIDLIVNDEGELLAFGLTPGNVDDRQPVPALTKQLFGQLFGDRGYISQALHDILFAQGLELLTKICKNMKNRLMRLWDKLLLRKRALIASINDQLKNISQIEHTRHRSVTGFMVNLVAGLVAYTYQPKKPSLSLRRDPRLPMLIG